MSNEIWIFAEHREQVLTPATSGLLGEARKLARDLNGKPCACLLGSKIRAFFSLLGDSGAEKIYFLEDEIFSDYSLDAYVHILEGLISEYRPLVMIFDASTSGSELAARIAWRMKLPCITEVKRIDVDGENLVISKSCYEDKVYQNVIFSPEKTVILTFLPEDMDINENNVSGEGELVEGKPYYAMGRTRTRCFKFLKGDPKKISLEEADMIVAGGKGIGNDASILEDLADVLGASVGGTRPLVDEGILGFERQIGITGKSVSPRVLFVVGVSGAREFAAGTDRAKLTIAVNTDDNAPVFKNADLKVHGDLKEIVPALAKRLRQRKENNK
jgi:electron transfer flavoprotein alpha subunit